MVSAPDFDKKMRKLEEYVIFTTKWGYFGLAGSEKGLLQTSLPGPGYDQIEARLLANHPLAQFNPSFFKQLQGRIAAYFAGASANFDLEIPLDLTDLTPFQAAVLTACRRVKLGKTITYGQLAQKIGNPKAARAVGTALAKNPIPLIVPCHRILAANNKLGGFSAPGGISLKKKMLSLEKTAAK